MKFLHICLLAGTMLIAKNAGAQGAEEIFKKHLDAVGGEANWKKINTVKITGGMNQGGVEISLGQTIANGKGYRNDISAMGQNGYQILTPTEGWTFMPFMGQKEPVKLTADQLKGTSGKINYRRAQFVDRSAFSSLEMDGTDTINNVACYKLKVKGVDGDQQECYFDSKTYYLVRMDVKVEMAGEQQEATVNFSNFKKLPEGITVPMTMETAQGNFNYSSIEINKPVSDAIFKPSSK